MYKAVRQYYFRLTIKNRLILAIFGATASVFLLASWILLSLGTNVIQNQAEEDLKNTVSVLKQDFVKVLLLDSADIAADAVSRIEAFPSIMSAFIYDKKKAFQFGYHKQGTEAVPAPAYQHTDTRFHDNYMELYAPLIFQNQEFGSVYIRYSLDKFKSRLVDLYRWLVLVALCVLVASLLLAIRLQRSFSEPVAKLATAFEKVSDNEDYQLRVVTEDQSEIGRLYDGFNKMISTIQTSNERLDQTRDRLHVTLESIADGVISCDDSGRIVYVNNNAERMLSSFRKHLEGKVINDVVKFVREHDQKEEVMPIHRALWEAREIPLESDVLLLPESADALPVSVSAKPMWGADGSVLGAVLVMRDETLSREFEKKLAFQATHDALTGLVNRSAFEAILQTQIENAREKGVTHVLLYMDLDQFKVVNDTCGHLAGDQLLMQLSSLLVDHLRSSDELSRLGGDEFGVLLQDCDVESARVVAETLRKTVEEFRFAWENNIFAIGVSIGMVVIDRSTASIKEVLSAADIACYLAKDRGRNRVHQYNEDDEEAQRKYGESHWVGKIASGLENGKFRLYRQIIQVANEAEAKGARGHYEILVRMLDDDGTVISPGSFLPAAERFGVIAGLDRWVVRTTLSFLASSQSELASLRRCSINLSGYTLTDEHFLEFVDAQFERTGVPPERICFEITETAAIGNLVVARKFIEHLKGLGCSFALDDFGSGLSSFGYLKNLDVDYLKIDGMFIRDIMTDPIDLAMVKSINEIGHVMGMKTIAEFVESDEIRSLLHNIGVDYVQGYAVHKPEELSLPVLTSLGKSA